MRMEKEEKLALFGRWLMVYDDEWNIPDFKGLDMQWRRRRSFDDFLAWQICQVWEYDPHMFLLASSPLTYGWHRRLLKTFDAQEGILLGP